VLRVEDARRLVGVIRGDRFEALWVCALTLGLRKGELLGLRWSDIDFGDATLTVRQALQRVGGHLVLVEPKSARSRRVVPVPPPTLAALRAYRMRQKAAQLAAGPAWRDTGLVFTTHLGGPLEPRNVNRSWYAIRSRAGLTGCPASRSSSPVRIVHAGGRGVTSDGDEDPWAQPDRADHEHLHACAPGDRARRDRRRCNGDLRMMVAPVGCTLGCTGATCTRTGVRASNADLGAGPGSRCVDFRLTLDEADSTGQRNTSVSREDSR